MDMYIYIYIYIYISYIYIYMYPKVSRTTSELPGPRGLQGFMAKLPENIVLSLKTAGALKMVVRACS